MNATLCIKVASVVAALSATTLMAAPVAVASDQPASAPAPPQKEVVIPTQPVTESPKPVVSATTVEPLREGEDPTRLLEQVASIGEPKQFAPDMWKHLKIQDEMSAVSF